MGFIVSLVVVAVGAILRFATNVHSATFNVRTIGGILMVVGIVGFVLAVIEWAYWEGWGPGGTARHRRTVILPDSSVGPPIHGPDGYARTVSPSPRAGDVFGPGPDATRPIETVVEEEERSFF